MCAGKQENYQGPHIFGQIKFPGILFIGLQDAFENV